MAGADWQGEARHGTARRGAARHGTARQGLARQAGNGLDRQGVARQGKAGTGNKGKIMTGSELKLLRKQLGLSLATAARQVETSVSTWCRWESGKQPIPLGAIKLFKILNKLT
jgi:DNA-binding transcriptional regulator YiaG